MKTFSESERQEIQQRIERATGQTFDHPWPEYFLTANQGRACMVKAELEKNTVSLRFAILTEAANGDIELFPFGGDRGKFVLN